MADAILRRLKSPTELRERVVLLIESHKDLPLADKTFLRRRLSQLGWEAFQQLLQLQQADTESTYTEIDALLQEIRLENPCLTLKDLAVNGRDLMALGIKGKSLGATLNALLDQVLEEALPNEKEALLDFAAARRE
jgi:tRNA nucleotidyltransferase (CCA-adding enzyme)